MLGSGNGLLAINIIGSIKCQLSPESMLTFLVCPSVQNLFLYILENKNLFQILDLSGSIVKEA